MKELKIGAVLIERGGNVLGIFTERDVSRRVAYPGRDPENTIVSQVMTSPVAFVEPSTTVREAMKVMSTTHCRHLPVYDGAQLVGLVSLGDLLRWLTADLEAHVRFLESYIRGI